MKISLLTVDVFYLIMQVSVKCNNLQFQQITQPTVIEQAAYILIAAGAFMFIVSFLGYCGALRESRCLLTCVSITVSINNNNNNNIYLTAIGLSPIGSGFKHIYKYLTLCY